MTYLSSNKLTGDNYVDWKRKLDIILTNEKHKFVLNTPCPTLPVEESTQNEKDTYDDWIRSDINTRYYILATIPFELQKKYQTYGTSAEMIHNLEKMFDVERCQVGHFASSSKGSILVTEACLVTDYCSYSWIVDSGATNHICNSLKEFRETRKLSEGQFSLRWGTGATVSAKAVGSIKLFFISNKFIVLNDVYYVPNFGKNIVSVACLVNNGFSFSFNNGIEIFRNDCLICKGYMYDNLYYLKTIKPTIYDTKVNADSQRVKKLKIEQTNETYLWHLRLGHINQERIKRLVKDGPLNSLHVDSLPTCESCLEGDELAFNTIFHCPETRN